MMIIVMIPPPPFPLTVRCDSLKFQIARFMVSKFQSICKRVFFSEVKEKRKRHKQMVTYNTIENLHNKISITWVKLYHIFTALIIKISHYVAHDFLCRQLSTWIYFQSDENLHRIENVQVIGVSRTTS